MMTHWSKNFGFCLVLLGLALGMRGQALGSTCCEQIFTILGKTRGQHSLLAFDEYIGPGCRGHCLFAVFLDSEVPLVLTDECYDSSCVKTLRDYLSGTELERVDTINGHSGKYYLDDTTWFVLPQFDSTFYERHVDMIAVGKGDALQWRLKCTSDCADYPEFSGAEVELLWKHSRGIYKNYSIGVALYYRESRLLVLTTNQPNRAAGLDTIHGVLIYRIQGGK